jgi:hypothetical protein
MSKSKKKLKKKVKKLKAEKTFWKDEVIDLLWIANHFRHKFQSK